MNEESIYMNKIVLHSDLTSWSIKITIARVLEETFFFIRESFQSKCKITNIGKMVLQLKKTNSWFSGIG